MLQPHYGVLYPQLLGSVESYFRTQGSNIDERCTACIELMIQVRSDTIDLEGPKRLTLHANPRSMEPKIAG